MNKPQQIIETELHNYFEQLKPLLLKKIRRLEQDNLTIEDKVSINFEFVKEAAVLFIPVMKSFITNPVKAATKTASRELKIFGSLGMISIMLLVFFIIGWLTLSVLVGAWFYDQGRSLSDSVLYSLIFQLISFLIVSSAGWLFLSKSAIVSFFGLFKQKQKSIEKQFENHKNDE
jgi:hypothetical protein